MVQRLRAFCPKEPLRRIEHAPAVPALGPSAVAAVQPAGHCFHAGRICRSRRPPRQRRRPLEAPGTCGAEGRKAGRGRRVWRRNACMRVQHLPSIRSARDLIALPLRPSRVGLPLRVLLKAAQSSSTSASSVACAAACGGKRKPPLARRARTRFFGRGKNSARRSFAARRLEGGLTPSRSPGCPLGSSSTVSRLSITVRHACRVWICLVSISERRCRTRARRRLRPAASRSGLAAPRAEHLQGSERISF
jgi:hypothetical protein